VVLLSDLPTHIEWGLRGVRGGRGGGGERERAATLLTRAFPSTPRWPCSGLPRTSGHPLKPAAADGPGPASAWPPPGGRGA
jgi:hypothetical protein